MVKNKSTTILPFIRHVYKQLKFINSFNMKPKISMLVILSLCSLLAVGNYNNASAQAKKRTVKTTDSLSKRVEGSKNLNGAGKADLVLNESDFAREGRITLLALLKRKIEGFGEGMATNDDRIGGGGVGGLGQIWQIKGKRVNFVFDGLNIEDFYTPDPEGHYGYLKHYLEAVTTEDILGVEVMYPGKYTQTYVNRFNPADGGQRGVYSSNAMDRFNNSRQVWIEITTRGHNTKVNSFSFGSEGSRSSR
jgi:hypothetical protein